MALHLDPQGSEPLGEERRVRVTDIGEERQVARDGIQRLAHGALVCPGCDLPIVIERSVGAGTALRCGFCDHEARAREYVVADVYDTVANEVYVVARVA
jgi:hypothetical protein